MGRVNNIEDSDIVIAINSKDGILLGPQTRIFIKDGSKLVSIDLKKVLFFKSEGNYISVVFEDRKILHGVIAYIKK